MTKEDEEGDHQQLDGWEGMCDMLQYQGKDWKKGSGWIEKNGVGNHIHSVTLIN
jgi:hypothetical protein